MTVSTLFLLMAEFGTGQIPMEKVAEKYWGLSRPVACQRAMLMRLPVPAYRGAPSQKAGWFINAVDLADYLDKQRADAHDYYKRLNAAAEAALSRAEGVRRAG